MNASRLAFDTVGAGDRTLLLMPGWCESRTVYAQFAQLARSKYRVIRLDWRGHGESMPAEGDFTADDLLIDALAVLDATAAGAVTPIAIAHASWVAVELARRHPDRVRDLVFLDWVFTDPPAEFLEAVRAFGDVSRWEQARASLLDLWLAGTDNPIMTDHIRGDLSRLGFDMWSRAGREIERAYTMHGSPMRMLGATPPGVRALHIFALNRDDGYLAEQRRFSTANPWFEVERLDSLTHLPVLERPADVLGLVEQFHAR